MKLISPLEIDFIVRKLKEGAVVAHRTETCYGLTTDIFNKKSVERLYKIKGMPKDRPSSILINSFEEAKKYGEFSDEALSLAKIYWPGPLTIVVPRKSSLPAFLNMGTKTIGMRIPSDAFCLGLLYLFNGPLLTTSANVHGKKECYHHKDVFKNFEGRELMPDIVVENGQLKKEAPSTIVSFKGKEMNVLRQGGIIL